MRGFGRPALAVPKGDQAAACVAAASVLAKVTRDRIMVGLHAELPEYGFDAHKGYCTPVHDAALAAHGPSGVHRRSFVNVRAAAAGSHTAAVGGGGMPGHAPVGGFGALPHNGGVHNGVAPVDDAPQPGGVQP